MHRAAGLRGGRRPAPPRPARRRVEGLRAGRAPARRGGRRRPPSDRSAAHLRCADGPRPQPRPRATPSIKRSRAGVRAVALALVVLAAHRGGPGGRLRRLGQRRAAGRPHPQRRRRGHRDPAGDRVRAALRAGRAPRRPRGGRGDLRVSACVAGFEAVDRLVHPHDVEPPGRPGRRGRDRVRRQLGRRDRPHARRPAPRQPGADRRRRPRARRRLRLARPSSPRRSSSRSASASPTRSSASPSPLVILRITWHSWGTVRGHDHHHHR